MLEKLLPTIIIHSSLHTIAFPFISSTTDTLTSFCYCSTSICALNHDSWERERGRGSWWGFGLERLCPTKAPTTIMADILVGINRGHHLPLWVTFIDLIYYIFGFAKSLPCSKYLLIRWEELRDPLHVFVSFVSCFFFSGCLARCLSFGLVSVWRPLSRIAISSNVQWQNPTLIVLHHESTAKNKIGSVSINIKNSRK